MQPMSAHGMVWSMKRAFLLIVALTLGCCEASAAKESSDAGAGEMRAVIQQFTADYDALASTYTIQISPMRIARFEKFLSDEQAKLQAIDFDALSEEGKIDYLLLKNRLTGRNQRTRAVSAPYCTNAAT